MIQIYIKSLLDDISFDKFDCGNSSVNEFTRNAYYEEIMKLSSTKLIFYNNRLIGYYTIDMFQIAADENDYSAIRLKYIGVKKIFQGKGFGTEVLKYIINNSKLFSRFAGCRYLILDSIKEKASWYENIGFQYFDRTELNTDKPTILMYMDFQDIDKINAYFEY